MSSQNVSEYKVERVPTNYVPKIPYTFTRYTIDGFPEVRSGNPIDTIVQIPFREFDSAPFSELSRIGIVPNTKYIRYEVQHETWVDYLVRIEGRIHTRVKRVVVFNMYVHQDDKKRIWFRAQKKIIDEFLKRVNTTYFLKFQRSGFVVGIQHKFDVDRLVLDYNSAGKSLWEIVSGWFINLTIPKLKTAFLDGPEVTESTYWEEYSESGDLASVDLVKAYAGEKIRAIVTGQGTIVFRRAVGEEIALELLDELANNLSVYTVDTPVKGLGSQRENADEGDSGNGDAESDT